MKSILGHEEMKGLFGSICEEFENKFKLAKLDMSDFPKLHSSNQETIHFITKGEKMKPLKLTKIRQLISNSDMEYLHERVHEGEDVEAQIHEIVDLDIAQWTKAGETLFHATGKSGNLKALDQLISKVIIKVCVFVPCGSGRMRMRKGESSEYKSQVE